MAIGTMEALHGSDFFTFFNIHEVGRQASGRTGVLTVLCKPGGFQEHIDISFDVDTKDNVLLARLLLDRSWIGDHSHVNPFANDISKSFIRALVPPNEQSAIEPLVQAIQDANGIDDKRISLHDQPRDLTPNFNAIKAIGVYLQAIPRHEIAMAGCNLSMENVNVGARNRLEITFRSR